MAETETRPRLKILVIRFSSIGDIVLTTPVLRCLKEQLSGCEVHYLTKAGYRDILQHNPHIDRLHLLEDSLRTVIRELREERFDYIIDLHCNLRSLRIKLALRGKKYTFRKENRKKCLMVRLKRPLQIPHVVQRYLQAAAPLGIKDDGRGLEWHFPPAGEPSLDFLPEKAQQQYAAFVIGAQHETKKLPPEKIARIIRNMPMLVVLIGGKQERQQAEWISQQCENAINLCGELSLHQSAAAVKHAQVVLTHDTGFMHIATAFQQRIISYWGNTVPAFGMTPYYGTANANRAVMQEVKGLSCRPCSKIGWKECPKGHFMCMWQQEEDVRITG